MLSSNLPASRFGFETDLCSVGRVQQVVGERFGVVIFQDTIGGRLRAAGLTYQKPERQYSEIGEEAREAWLRTEVPRIRRAVRKYRAILYFQDESSLSLTALLGKTWSPRGSTPKVRVTGQRPTTRPLEGLVGRSRVPLLTPSHCPALGVHLIPPTFSQDTMAVSKFFSLSVQD